jgi:HEAT repeat protein
LGTRLRGARARVGQCRGLATDDSSHSDSSVGDPPAVASDAPDPTGADAGIARRLTVVLAGHRGDRATLVAAAIDAVPEVRAAALTGLSRAGALDSALVVRALSDPEAMVRRRACTVAAEGPSDPVVLAALVDRLADSDAGVVEVAAFACGERVDADASTVAALSGVATGHDDHLCREAAVAALGSVGHPAGLPAVLHGCRDRHTVRRRAVLALAAFDGPEVTAELTRLADDRDLQVRQAAEELLAIEAGEEHRPGRS